MKLQEKYKKEIAPALMKEFGWSNPMQVPRLSKVVVNITTKEAVQNPKVLDSAASELATITGQKPVITRARKSIATYKLRENMPIGVMVTLRGEKMYDFVAKLISIALPRVRDFKGVSGKAFDGRGNYSLGIQEQIIFPEIDYDKLERVQGMNIVICTSAKSDAEGKALLKHMGMPFRN
jgi:large subunit ribosomal protein L5